MNYYKNLGVAALAVCLLVMAEGCGSSAGETAAVKGTPGVQASTGTAAVSGAVQAGNGSTAPAERVRLVRSALPQLVKLPGQLAAFEEVSIFPKVNGYVTDVRVDVGSHVKKGQLLMQLEAPELEQATTQAKERYAQAKLDATISEQNYERMRQAAETPGAVSPMNLASLKAKADADSALCNAEKANWQMQQAILG